MRSFNRLTGVILVVVLVHLAAKGQEQLGIRLDNYSGMDQAWANPAFVASSPLNYDLHLAGVGFFANNNYGYLRHTSLLDMRNKNDVVAAWDLENTTLRPGTLVSDAYDTPTRKFAKVNLQITGPSVMFKIDEVHSIGMFSNMRAAFSVTRIPVVLGYYEYNRQQYNNRFELTPFEAAGAIWNETGIHYGYKSDQSNGAISFGVNLKYNSFMEAGFFGLQNKAGYTKISPDSVQVDLPAVEIAITTGNIRQVDVDMDSKQVSIGDIKPRIYGHSVSADLGVSVEITDNDVDGYRWRAGASVMDFGLAKISRDAEFHTSYPIPQSTLIDFTAYQSVSNYDSLVEKLSDAALGDPAASLKARSFKMGLPTALSLQGDYQFVPNVFMGGLIVQPFGLSRYNLKRTAVLAVAPRFENRYFSFSLPVTVRDWKSARMGMSARLGFVSFGTDNLGSIIRKRDFTGTDLYFSLRVNAINLPQFFSGMGGRKRHSKLGCYEF